MAVTGEKPESGVRIELARERGASTPLVYEGSAETPDAVIGVRVTVAAEGEVKVDYTEPNDPHATRELEDRVRMLVRTVLKHAKSDGVAPPLRISRWRGDRGDK